MKTIDIYIDEQMREMRVKFRDMFSCWTVNDMDGMIEKAEEAKLKLESFIGYLQNKRKFP